MIKFLLNSPIVHAATITPNKGTNTIPDLIMSFLFYFNTLIAGLALFGILYGAFLFMTSGGNPDKVSKARKALLYSLIGIFLVAAALIVVNSLDVFVTDLTD